MYGKNSGTGNAQLSPRSKIISLGLNQVEAPPLRFRPLVKAADFPFSDQAERNDQQQKYQSTNYDYDHEYVQDTGSKYEKDYPPSPEQLRSQYTEFQKQLIAEQMSGNYDHGHNDGRAKTLAKGLEYQGYLSAPSPAGVDKEKLLARYAEYQKKLVADETHLIEPTRQKFVRKIDEDYGPGLVIGKQTDKETDYRAKREAQAAYGRQLSNDIRSKPIAGDRKIVERRAHSPEPTQTNFLTRIGDRTDGSGETEADRRRREAQRILSTNRDDVLTRLHEASSPENRKFREDRAHGRVEEAVKFEEAPYRFIGGSPEAAKDRKRAMQEQYLAQLLQDNGPPSQGRTHQPTPPAEYVNRSGWTGLNIGGHSMDEAHQGASKNEKFLKQAAYKRLLDQQRMQADDLQRMDQMKYGKY